MNMQNISNLYFIGALLVGAFMFTGCKKEEPVDNLPPLLDPCICCADNCGEENITSISKE